MRKYLLTYFVFSTINFFSQTTLALTNNTYKITIDNIADYANNPQFFTVATLNVGWDRGTEWDLTVKGERFQVQTQYSSLGTDLQPENLKLKAVNFCSTPDVLVAANNITTSTYSDLGTPYVASPGGTKYYIVGTAADDPQITSNDPLCPGPLDGLGDFINNNNGLAITHPGTHSFRIDLELDINDFFTLGTQYNPGIYIYDLLFEFNEDNGITIAPSQSLQVEVEILPILDLKLTGTNQLNFTFTDISQYLSGETKFSTSILEINSNVDWDLYALGTSTENESGTAKWDVQAQYSQSLSGTSTFPLTSLELFQTPSNPSSTGNDDYSAAFANPPLGANNIEVSKSTLLPVAVAGTGSLLAKSIAGRMLAQAGANDFISPGSYLIPGGTWDRNQFRYTMSYRLTPGLPANFSNGRETGAPIADYLRPGVYTMQVRYVLSSDE